MPLLLDLKLYDLLLAFFRGRGLSFVCGCRLILIDQDHEKHRQNQENNQENKLSFKIQNRPNIFFHFDFYLLSFFLSPKAASKTRTGNLPFGQKRVVEVISNRLSANTAKINLRLLYLPRSVPIYRDCFGVADSFGEPFFSLSR